MPNGHHREAADPGAIQSGNGDTATRRRMPRARHILDRFMVVRRHWLAALVLFTLVFGFLLYTTLVTEPTYQANATLTIETSVGSGSMLADLAALGKPSKVETEMEVLRSYRIARGAAEVLIGLPPHGYTPTPPVEYDAQGEPLPPKEPEDTGPTWYGTFTSEVNAYRPWEVLMRGLRGGRQPVPLTVETNHLLSGKSRNSYTFLFGAEPGTLQVTGSYQGEDASEDLTGITWGEPFEARGQRWVVRAPKGDVKGREYVVAVESVETAAARIHGGVAVNPVGRYTDVVEIVSAAGTPRHARETATALAESYIALRQKSKSSNVSSNQGWIEREVKRLEIQLKERQDALKSYIEQNDAVLLSEKTAAALEEAKELRAKKADLERETELAGWQLERLQKGQSLGLDAQVALLGSDGSNPMSNALFTRYADLKRERAGLLQDRNTPESDIVRKKDAEITATENELKAILALALETAITNNQRILDIRRRQTETVKAELVGAEAALNALPDKERQLLGLQAEVDTRLGLLQRYKEKQLELNSASNTADVAATIVDQARTPQSRTSPSLFRMGLLGLFLGLLAAVGIAFFLEAMDHKIRTPQQLEEATGLTIYATVPAFDSVARRHRPREKNALVTIDNPNSIVSESYRALRANIRFAHKDRRVRTMAITSALPQEGKTTTTCNLGVVMAQAGSRTIIVDADLRRPSTHVVFRGERKPGLTEVLKGDAQWRDHLRPTGVEGLDVLHAGADIGNPAALLDSSAFARMLAELKEAYDYVLFDVPPILAVSDAAAFFQSLDGIVLLNRDGKCGADAVDGAREQVERLGGHVLGAIFNGFDASRSFRRGYGSYGSYGYYGAYGSYGYYGPSGHGGESATEAAAPAPKAKTS